MAVLDRPDCSLHYWCQGRGRPRYLLVHGAFCTHADWRFVATELSRAGSVTVLDLRGHGASTAPAATCTIEGFAADVEALIASLHWAGTFVVGHSMACRVVLQAAADLGDQVAGVALVDGGWSPTTIEDVRRRRRERFNADFRPQTATKFEQMFTPTFPPSERDRIMAGVHGLDSDVADAVTGSSWIWDAVAAADVLQRINVPVLAIQTTSAEGPIRRPLRPNESTDWLEMMRASVADLRVDTLSGLGHFPMIEVPLVITEAIRRFAIGR